MKRHPRLAAMRAARLSKEALIAAPYQERAVASDRRAASTQKALDALQRITASKMGAMINEEISHKMADGVRRLIMKAIIDAKAEGPDASVKIEISGSEIAWSDPSSIQRRVLDEWRREALPNARLTAVSDSPEAINQCVTIFDIRVPDIGYRQYIANQF